MTVWIWIGVSALLVWWLGKITRWPRWVRGIVGLALGYPLTLLVYFLFGLLF